jgi:DNA-3-methyladenine glycosylase
MYEPLPREFYARDTVDVAKELLGKLLIRVIDGRVLSGIIVETEAYKDSIDEASHAYRGISKRNRVMFGEVGHAYVYFIYGNHYCLNAVARDSDSRAGAVLIRALEPVDGIEMMHRSSRYNDRVASGPGRLTRALMIGKEHNGLDLTIRGSLYIAHYRDISSDSISSTQRIGITKAKDRLWRFMIKGNRYVSR